MLVNTHFLAVIGSQHNWVNSDFKSLLISIEASSQIPQASVQKHTHVFSADITKKLKVNTLNTTALLAFAAVGPAGHVAIDR